MDDERRTIVDKYVQGREKIIGKGMIDPWEDPKFEIYHVTDRYGFIHDHHLPERFTEHEHKLKIQENSRLSKWLKMLSSWENYFPSSDKLRKRIYKGIPDAVRGEVWSRIMGVPTVKQEQEGKYQEMLAWGLDHSTDIRQIDLDVNRTYRNHIMFKDRYDTKQQMLFRVLTAYSVYNSEIGYCQGMSQIAALLLMYMDEEDSFWALSKLMSDDRHAMHGFFIPGFPKLVRFSKHHDRIIKKFLPKLSKHLKKFNIDSTLYTLKWFFQCFLDRVPFSLTLRLWDCFLYEGEVILTGMSYTLLKLHKRTLLRKSMEQLIEFLQIELERDFGYHDDQAIAALQQSVQELKRNNLLHPVEPPSLAELPSRPFGLLTAEDANSSLFGNDDQSIVGSIILKPADSVSLAQTSRTESEVNEEDLENESLSKPQNVSSDQNSIATDSVKLSLSLYDNVDLSESLAAAKRRNEPGNALSENVEVSSDSNPINTSGEAENVIFVSKEEKRVTEKKIERNSHSSSEILINEKEENFVSVVTPISQQLDQLCSELKRISSECDKTLATEEKIKSYASNSITNVLNYDLSVSQSEYNNYEWPDRADLITDGTNQLASSKMYQKNSEDSYFEKNSIKNESEISEHSILMTSKSTEESASNLNSQHYSSYKSETEYNKVKKVETGNGKALRTPWKRGSEKRQGMVVVSPTSPTSPTSPPGSNDKNERPSLIPRYVAKSQTSPLSSNLPSSSQSKPESNTNNSRIKQLGKNDSQRNNKSVDESTKLRIFVPYQFEKQTIDSNKIKLRVDSPTQLKDSKFMPAVDT